MTPSLPLSWIGTVNRHRDQGVFHLVSEREVFGKVMVGAACGAHPFAFTGSFPDGHRAVSPRCQRCEKIAKAAIRGGCLDRRVTSAPCHPKSSLLWLQAPGGILLKTDLGHGVMAYEGRCPECGKTFKVLA